MNGEFNILGILCPSLLIYLLIAFLLTQLINRCLDHLNAYRFIWHRPLFDSALTVILTGLLVMLTSLIRP